MEIMNELSFQQSFILAVAVSAGLTGLLAWIYVLANRAKGKGERVAEAIIPESPVREEVAPPRQYSGEILQYQREMGSEISILSESLEVCKALSDQLIRNGVPAEGTGRNLNDPDLSEAASGSKLDITSELRKLYRHVERNSYREVVNQD